MSPGVRRLRSSDWRVWRDMRLAALSESPGAFTSSLAREQHYGDDEWRARLDPDRDLKAVADAEAGLVAAWQPPGRRDAAELYSMWVHPRWRGRGIGGSLISEVLDWADEHGYARVDLWVVEGNAAAERLYLRHGFLMTEERQPHPGHPGVLERVMSRELRRQLPDRPPGGA